MKSNVAMQGKGKSQTAGRLRRRLMPVLIATCFGPGFAFANPSGHQVVSGQASFNQQGSVLTITNSPGAIINWQNFSINAGETTRFIQESASSSVLNRVVGQDPSAILGTLQSNGQVLLINPNGILFGQGAVVDVNGLVASTLNISNEDFLAGRMKFEGGGLGNVKNEGTINTASGGKVYLIAPNVENSGIINSPQGDVLLAAGHTVHLVDSTNPALHVVVSAPEHEALNVGQIVTQGGQASVYGALVRQRGVVSADSAVVGENGRIYFRASREIDLAAGSTTSANGVAGGSVRLQSDDVTMVSGTLEAKGELDKGGRIEVLGDKVGVMDGAVVDASGKTGGGTVLIGGDYLGQGSVPNATVTYTGPQARIRADATENGDGGKVIVWSDDTTRSYAHISVRGGEEGGNGGFVETSGKRFLDVGSAFPDVSAPKGEAGTWLLDPTEITISTGTNSGMNGVVSPFMSAQSGGSILNVNTLVSYLETNGHAIVQTGGFEVDGSIVVDAAIMPSLPSGGSLELKASGDVVVNYQIGSSSSPGLDISLWANADNTGTGDVRILNIVDSEGGDINIRGQGVHLLSGGVLDSGTTGRIDVQATGTGTGFTMDAGSNVNGHALRVNSDSMTLNGGINVFGTPDTSGGVYLNTYTPNRAISLGTKSPGTLGLSASELQAIQAAYLRIGEPINTGGITVNSAITFANNTIDTLWLASSGTITIAGALAKQLGGTDTEIDLHSNGNNIHIAAGGSIAGWERNRFNSGTNGDVILDAGTTVTADSLGEIEINADTLTLNGTITADSVDIRPYTSGRGITVGSSTCDASTPGCLTVTNLSRIDAMTIGIGHHDDSSGTFSSRAGAIHVAGITSGTGNTLTDRHANTTRIGLLSGGNVTQSGAIDVLELGVISGANVVLDHGANKVTSLIGLTNGGGFSLTNSQALDVTYILEGDDYYEGIVTNGGGVSLRTTGGDLTLTYDVNAGSGNVRLQSAGAVSGSYVIANGLDVSSANGINLNTQVNALTATNTDTDGTSAIYVYNERSFDVHDVRQAGNAGAIDLYAANNILAVTPSSPDMRIAGIVDAGSGGAVSLHSDGAIVNSGGTVGGTYLDAYAVRGISLNSQVAALSAENQGMNDTSIDITNTGALHVVYLGQAAGAGGISLKNHGDLIIAGDPLDTVTPVVLTHSGSISLAAHSPLTVDGLVKSTSGNISLVANPSLSGNDNLVINGRVETGGTITLAAGGTVTINGSVSGTPAILENVASSGSTSTTSSAIDAVTNTINAATDSLTRTSNTTTKTNSTTAADSQPESTESTESSETTDGEATAETNSGASKDEPAKKMYCN